MRLAREFEASEGPDLGGFLEYLDSRAASRDREAEAATRAEGHAGVRVMTVHGAKGLEFEVVAVADLGRNLQLGWSPLRVQPGEEGPEGGELARVGVQLGRLGRPAARLHDYQELADLAAERDAEEEARLAYVAATRAKRRLILERNLQPERTERRASSIRRKPIALQLIRSLLDGDVTDRELEIPAAGDGYPAGRLRVSVSAPGSGRRGRAAGARAGRAPPRRRRSDAEPPLGRPEVPPALIGGLSYSALSAFENCGYRFYVERVLGIGEPEVVEPVDGDESRPAPEVRRRFGPGARRPLPARVERAQPLARAERRAGRGRPAGAGARGDDGRAEVIALTKAFLDSPLREEIGDAQGQPRGPLRALDRRHADPRLDRPARGAPRRLGAGRRLQDRPSRQAATRRRSSAATRSSATSTRWPPPPAARRSRPRTCSSSGRTSRCATSFDEAELEAARARWRPCSERLAAGRFEVTDRPHRALCADCPARERLCSHARRRRCATTPIRRSSRAPMTSRPTPAEPQLTLLEGG